MISGIVIAQVLLTLIVGLWLGAKFGDTSIIKFFGRNDWFVGAFLALVGYMNFAVYDVTYIKNLNLMLVVFGLIMVMISVLDVSKRKK